MAKKEFNIEEKYLIDRAKQISKECSRDLVLIHCFSMGPGDAVGIYYARNKDACKYAELIGKEIMKCSDGKD